MMRNGIHTGPGRKTMYPLHKDIYEHRNDKRPTGRARHRPDPDVIDGRRFNFLDRRLKRHQRAIHKHATEHELKMGEKHIKRMRQEGFAE